MAESTHVRAEIDQKSLVGLDEMILPLHLSTCVCENGMRAIDPVHEIDVARGGCAVRRQRNNTIDFLSSWSLLLDAVVTRQDLQRAGK